MIWEVRSPKGVDEELHSQVQQYQSSLGVPCRANGSQGARNSQSDKRGCTACLRVGTGKGWGPGQGLVQIMAPEVQRLNVGLLDPNGSVDIKYSHSVQF